MARNPARQRPGLPFIAPLVMAASLIPHMAAQETTLHVDVKLVSFFVSVTDQSGAVVGGLGRGDFSLNEDGRPQQIAIFERQSELPLNLTLAIDTSDSVFKDLTMEQRAAKRFVHAILRPQDKVSLLDFASTV